MTTDKPKPIRIMIALPIDTAERVERHRIARGFKSMNAALVHLIHEGLDEHENGELYRRLQRWGASIP